VSASDVNKTFLSRPRPRLWTSRSRPRPRLRVSRPRLFSQDQGKTLLGRPMNRLPYIFAIVTKCTQQYTHKVTWHTDAEAPTFHFEYRGTTVAYQGFFGWGGERTEEIKNFFYFVVVVNIPFLRILTHFFRKPHCLSWQMNECKQKSNW